MSFEQSQKNINETEADVEQERLPKHVKALAAVSAGALWLASPFELSKEDEESVKEKGWLKTAARKAISAYELIGKADDAVVENKWDELFKKKEGAGN